jgi:hypothetical protein
MDRGEFLKKSGVAGILGSFPALGGVAWAHGNDRRRRGWKRRFYFVALSGVEETVTGGDSIAMSGFGRFNPRDGRILAVGEFIHFDGTNFGSPDNVIGTGKWRATRLLSFEQIGVWGVGVAGIIEMRIKLFPCEGPVIRGATLKVVCNLGPAGIFTDPFQQEGYTLTLPNGVTFSPFTPPSGLTIFTRRCGEVR